MASSETIVFEQYYQHLRHVENYRHNFTNMFLIFIAALLATFSQIEPEPVFLIGVFAVMFAVSILGYFFSLKAGDLVYAYSQAIDDLIKGWSVPNFACKLSPWKPYRSMSNAYKSFYVIASIVWLVLLAYYLCSLCSR